jgi:N-acetylglucosamine-6-phosphate deacetylase
MRFFATSIDEQAFYQIDITDGVSRKLEVAGHQYEAGLQHSLDPKHYIFPGFIDLQVNGYRGVDMSDPKLDAETIDQFCREMALMGVTGFLPTITTNGQNELLCSLKNLAQLTTQSQLFRSMSLGIHLEGPYISPDDGPRGAHPKPFCRPPEISEFRLLQDAADGQIRILTLSPEYDQAADFIRQISDKVVVSIGHTAATPDQIRNAVDAGASMSTHLGNGMHPNIPRHPNYLWEQLAADELSGGMIADGVHLPHAVLKSFVRAKTLDNCFLVSDTTSLSGMPVGLYENSVLGDVEVTDDDRLVVAGQRILNAGAYQPLKAAIPIISRAAGLAFSQAVKLACDNPLTAIHQTANPSNYVIISKSMENEIEIKATLINEQMVSIR